LRHAARIRDRGHQRHGAVVGRRCAASNRGRVHILCTGDGHGTHAGSRPGARGTEVIIDGDGFVEGTEVRFAGSLARSTFVDASRLTAVVPAGEPGPIEVLVRNAFGEVRLPGGYTYFEDLVVLDLEPRWGPVAGGTEVGFRGAGLVEGGRVVFGEAEAAILRSELDRTRLVVETPRGRAGLVNVALENVNGTWRGQDAFLYVDPDATGFEVVGVVPGRVSSAGGDVIEIGGAGFSDATVALIDDVPLDCAATNANILRCTAPAHAAGAVDLVVRDGDASRVLPGGLTFFQRVDIYTLRPNRGRRARRHRRGGAWRGLHRRNEPDARR
jgi:hypothetical protein